METERNELEMPKSRVYILTDEQDNVVRIEGEYTLPSDLTGWIFIAEGYGDEFSLGQTHYLDKPLINDEGAYNYKYINGEIVEV